jgi:uncharacterized protein with ParB-like and HNH nuclease domain
MSDTKYKTEIQSVEKIFENNFNIPIYQRLYVWEDNQITTLFEDLYSAFNHNKDDIYYLGSIVVVENNNTLDLIDGQQRFTTLSILKNILGDTLDKNKLNFAIRENIWSEFEKKESDCEDITRMINAKNIFSAEISKMTDEVKNGFEDFVNKKVQLNFISIPKNADLNKIFELINGRGEQLQQHEILKAKIVAKVDDECKNAYGKVWDIVANMNDFLAVNIKNSVFEKNEEKNKNITWEKYFKNDYTNFCNLITKLDDGNNTYRDGKSIKDIACENYSYNENNNKADNSNEETDSKYEAIISFSTFLLYALVAKEKSNYFEVNGDLNIQFKETNLIAIFDKFVNNSNDKFCNEFIEFLFEFRLKFDKHIIKNKIKIDEKGYETNHGIFIVDELKSSKNTTKQIKVLEGSKNLALLQSMLYHAHTRQTQEWVIPFLSNVKVDSDIELLKNIDNQLYSTIKSNGTVLERACNYPENKNIEINNIQDYINKTPENYHHFSRYWFYKMDWIIYCKKPENLIIQDDFKFSAKNSIEHISPQTKNTGNTCNGVSNDNLHCFGNLALVSGSDNSSFDNKSFGEKKSQFDNDNTNLRHNLKLKMVFQEEGWNNNNMKIHQEKCVDLIKKYLNGVE